MTQFYVLLMLIMSWPPVAGAEAFPTGPACKEAGQAWLMERQDGHPERSAKCFAVEVEGKDA
jgi:hypothetical protein